MKEVLQNICIISLFFIAISGCAIYGPQDVLIDAGFVAYLNKKRADIYVTENESDIKGCNFIKHVKANTSFGGLLFQEKALEKTISDLTHDSVEVGANVLLIRSKYKSFSGSSSEGDAYQCPDPHQSCQ